MTIEQQYARVRPRSRKPVSMGFYLFWLTRIAVFQSTVWL